MRRSRTRHRATKHAKRTSHARDRMHSIAQHAACVTYTMQRAACTMHNRKGTPCGMHSAPCPMPRQQHAPGWRCIAGGAATLHRSHRAAASGRSTAAARASRSGTASCCAARPSRSAPLSLSSCTAMLACMVCGACALVAGLAVRQMCGAWCMHASLDAWRACRRPRVTPLALLHHAGSRAPRWPSAEHAPHECIRSSGW